MRCFVCVCVCVCVCVYLCVSVYLCVEADQRSMSKDDLSRAPPEGSVCVCVSVVWSRITLFEIRKTTRRKSGRRIKWKDQIRGNSDLLLRPREIKPVDDTLWKRRAGDVSAATASQHLEMPAAANTRFPPPLKWTTGHFDCHTFILSSSLFFNPLSLSLCFSLTEKPAVMNKELERMKV